MLFIIIFLLVAFTLSYFICWLIYRKIFKSQRKISKILVFLGGVGLIIFYYTPYSFYLEPSFWEFKEICELAPKIYQYNGGKIDKEYYNKLLAYYNMDWDSMIKIVKPIQTSDEFQIKYILKEHKIYDRVVFQLIYFVYLDKTKQDIIKISPYFFAKWDTKRKYLTTKSIASYDFILKTAYGSCTSEDKEF